MVDRARELHSQLACHAEISTRGRRSRDAALTPKLGILQVGNIPIRNLTPWGSPTPIELHKVTEHVEFLDDLDGDRAREIIQLVRAKLRATDFVDPQTLVEQLKQRWETIVAGNSFPVEAAASVLHELFPGIGDIVGEHGRSWGIRVQSVRGDREQIYLNRIHTAELAPDAVRDQVVISRLRDAGASATGMDRLVEGIQRIDGFAELVRFFQKELRLLMIYCRQIAEERV